MIVPKRVFPIASSPFAIPVAVCLAEMGFVELGNHTPKNGDCRFEYRETYNIFDGITYKVDDVG